MRRYEEYGDLGLIHRSRGKPSPKKWNIEEQELTVHLLETEWKGFGPTFVTEKLNKLKNIKTNKETVRQMMIAKGFWVAGKSKQHHRKMRERRAIRGMLVQLDGSPHDWFEGRAPKCTLIVFIDDATSEILWLEFVKSESFNGVAGSTKNYIEKHGRPVAFYVDYGSVFSVNLNNKERLKKTQFERIMKEMNVDVKHARSPQAKGRVERCNKTMQDRLVKEMRLSKINSMEEANQFLQHGNFIEHHNLKFAIQPAQEGNTHKNIDGYNLYKLFCFKEERIITNDFTISYRGALIQLLKQQMTIIRPKSRVIIHVHLDGKKTIHIRNQQLNFKEIGMRKQKFKPTDYVYAENFILQGQQLGAIPFKENQNDNTNTRDINVVNRNFSLC